MVVKRRKPGPKATPEGHRLLMAFKANRRERAALRLAARAAGESLSAFIRNAALKRAAQKAEGSR